MGQTLAPVFVTALTKITIFCDFLVPPLRPRFGTSKTSKRGRSGWKFFKKQSNIFVPPLCPRFAFCTVSCSRCGPAATDFQYDVNMKARQLLLYKAEAKQTVSSTRCGPALTYLKIRSIQRPYNHCYTKRRQNRLSVAPSVGLL
jgi:hypothetical protein